MVWIKRILLLPKYLPVGLAIGIKAIMFTPFPSGFQFESGDVPVRTAFPQHNAQVLPKLFDGRSAKKPVAVVDLENYETRFEYDDMRAQVDDAYPGVPFRANPEGCSDPRQDRKQAESRYSFG